MSRKIDLVTRKVAWVSEFSALKEPVLTIQGYAISLFSIGYLLIALYFTTKGFKAPGNPIIYHITPIGLIYFTIAGVFVALAFAPRNGVVKEVQLMRAITVIITNPMSIVPDKTESEEEAEKKKKKTKTKKKKPKKQKKPTEKKKVDLVKLDGGDKQ